MNLIPAGPVERALWAVLLVLVAGYMLGTWLNRKRSQRLGRWLQGGLEGLGRKPSWRWVKSISSGAQLTVGEPAQPFQQLQITYVLLTREVPLLWAIELLRGKRDLISLRASLRHAPGQEIEVLPYNSQYRRLVDEHAGDKPWQWQRVSDRLELATREAADGRAVSAVKAFLAQYGGYVERLSWRQRQPHLMLFLRLTGLETTAPTQLVKALREMGRALPPQQS